MKTYAYRPQRKFFAGCALGTATLAYFAARAVCNGETTLRLRVATLELTGDAAAAVYGVAAVLMAVLAVICALGSFMPARELTLTAMGMTAPTGFLGRKKRKLTWAEIEKVQAIDYPSARFLTLHLADGKISLSDRMLGKRDFEEVRATVLAETKLPLSS